MFEAKIDVDLDELEFKCSFCGEEQICFLDRKAIMHCVDCGEEFDPNPFELINKKLSRIRYHFANSGQGEIGDIKTKIKNKNKIYSNSKNTNSRSIASYLHEGGQTFLTN